MVPQAPSEVEKLSGVQKQLTPDETQIVDGESQVPTFPGAPLIEIAEPDKRIAPLPVTIAPSAAEEAGLTGEAAASILIGQPFMDLDRYNGHDATWQRLVSWDIPLGLVGDLHEISLLSNDDAHTRYRIFLADQNMNLPLDRATSTPLSLPWRDSKIPGGTSVWVEVMSSDGATNIQVDGVISGTYRSPE
jgi:hypothetical protein